MRPKTQRAASSARQRLLERAVRHVLRHGFAEGSLRAMAEELGTSHRMLIHHFGSAAGFWDAVMQALQEHDLRTLLQTGEGGRLPVLEDTWARLSSPTSLSIFKVMFQLYGEALQDRKRYAAFLSQFVDGWLEAIARALEERHGLSRQDARLEARLSLALVRGLALDLLTTGDRKGTTEALHTYARRTRAERRHRRRDT